MTRQCGDCQLCCSLLPVEEIGKRAGERCRWQKYHHGCTVHHQAAFPLFCATWSCLWLISPEASALSRPDRAHYVIDVIEDILFITYEPGGTPEQIQAMQVWCDPHFPDAWKDGALLALIERRKQPAIIRYNATDGFPLFPPSCSADGLWHKEEAKVNPDMPGNWSKLPASLRLL